MDNDRSELRWGVEQRLEFIEFRLFWEGHVNRSDVMEKFGLSVNQASSDLTCTVVWSSVRVALPNSGKMNCTGAFSFRSKS
jgi:hypothetical protein